MEEFPTLFIDLLTILATMLAILYIIGFTSFGKAYKTFTIYLVFIAVIQILLFYYASNKLNNLFLFSYYFIGQFIFMSFFYYYLIQKWWVLLVFGIVMLAIIIHYLINPSSFESYNTLGVSVTQSVIVVFALVYYYQSLTGKTKFLFVNTGVLLYFMASILFFASGNLILSLDFPIKTQQYISLINDVVYFIFIILIFLEWYRNYMPKKKTSEELPN